MKYFLLILLLPVCFFFAAFYINATMFRPDKITGSSVDGRKVLLRSGRNRLVGYLWNEAGTRGVIVFAHGMGTDVGYYLPEIHHFSAQGYKVFAFEYSGYCGSSGHFYGFPQAVKDLKNALEFIDNGALPVILMGHSMGGYAVCAVQQCRQKPVNGIVAYAPFFSPDEAIAEAVGKMGKNGKLLHRLLLPIQRVLFGKSYRLTAGAGLSCAKASALILQGSEDKEVTPDGCALYAHRGELTDAPVTFRLIEEAESSGHMTVLRKNGSQSVNDATMQQVDAFLNAILCK